MTLDEVKPGQECIVLKVKIAGSTGQRILDMGFVRGTELKIIRNAPLLDPIDISIKGYSVALRHKEAKEIEVELI